MPAFQIIKMAKSTDNQVEDEMVTVNKLPKNISSCWSI